MAKGKAMRRGIVTSLAFLLLASQAAADGKTKVRIDFVEALSPRDTTSSERFQKDYEGTVDLGRTLLKPRLAKCGYELETRTTFYEASDALKGKEIAAKVSAEGSWLIVGPRRSNHYLLLVQGAGTTPTASLMASADDVSKLGISHVSLSPTNSELALIAAKEAGTAAGRKATYMNVVSDDCAACVDFSRAFDVSAQKLGLRKVGEVKVRGENFDSEPVKATVMREKPAIVLLPNYSIVAAKIINALATVSPQPVFVGGDGWGDEKYGFLQAGLKSESSVGLTVRGFPPVEIGLRSFRLGREAISSKREFPFKGPYVAILRILEEVADILCTTHPTSNEAFTSATRKSWPARLHAPWGVSVYDLRSGQLGFRKTVGLR